MLDKQVLTLVATCLLGLTHAACPYWETEAFVRDFNIDTFLRTGPYGIQVARDSGTFDHDADCVKYTFSPDDSVVTWNLTRVFHKGDKTLQVVSKGTSKQLGTNKGNGAYYANVFDEYIKKKVEWNRYIVDIVYDDWWVWHFCSDNFPGVGTVTQTGIYTRSGNLPKEIYKDRVDRALARVGKKRSDLYPVKVC